MIKTKLKHHFIQRRIDKLLTHQAKNRVASNKKVNSVAILTDESFLSTLDVDVQDLVVEKLQLRNPKIYIYREFEKTQEKTAHQKVHIGVLRNKIHEHYNCGMFFLLHMGLESTSQIMHHLAH